MIGRAGTLIRSRLCEHDAQNEQAGFFWNMVVKETYPMEGSTMRDRPIREPIAAPSAIGVPT